MPLPSAGVPTYELALPSTGKKIKYRPFLVKEEKLLLITMQGEPELPDMYYDPSLPKEAKEEMKKIVDEDTKVWEKEVHSTVRTLLKGCILSRIKLDDLTNFDFEYIFLRIRAVSSGEDVSFKITCKDDGETEVPVKINLMDVEVQKKENHDRKIMLNDTLGLIMKYPGLNEFIDVTLLNKSMEEVDELFKLIADCVDQVFEGEEVYDSTNHTHEEIVKFIEGMTQKQFDKLQTFFNTIPVLSHTFEVTNPNTGVTSKYKLEGLQSFFG